jgi:hypothetical protein
VFATFAIGVLAGLAAVPPAAADGATVGRVVVPGDHFQPGEAISIAGSQISGQHVRLRLALGQTSADLGQATVASDGTFSTQATVPPGFPLGYAELSATDENGNSTSTIILIGDRAEGPDSQPGSNAALDDRGVWLALAAIGTLVFFVASAWYLHGRARADGGPAD